MKVGVNDRGSRKGYWLCQVGGWTALAIYQMSAGLTDSSGHLPRAVAFVEPLLASFYGLIATHLLYLHMQRRGWLQSLGPKLGVRLAGVILIFAVSLNALDMFGVYLLDRWLTLHLPFPRRIILLSFSSWVVVLVAWMALYLAIHELRRRRSQELRALRMEVIAQEAQLRGLRAQLNPHFLFNCLNSLREMVEENPQRAQLMVTQLSDLLRYALQSNQVDLVSLGSEVQAVRDYLALETIRFEDRLKVTWDIAAGALELRVPPMILQTLVENALKHGISQLPQGGEIEIIARHEGAVIQLEVVNSGNISPGSNGGGVGLRNARERLQLLYGQRAELTLADDGRQHVRATVTLPLEHAAALR